MHKIIFTSFIWYLRIIRQVFSIVMLFKLASLFYPFFYNYKVCKLFYKQKLVVAHSILEKRW